MFLKCTETCSLEPYAGHIIRLGGFHTYKFYYDKYAGTCKQFNRFNGGGNSNSFKTFKECMAKCKGVK